MYWKRRRKKEPVKVYWSQNWTGADVSACRV